jgi:LysM repeat protein
MPMGRRTILVALAGAATLTTLALPSLAGAQSLRGSRSTVARVYERASERGLYFYKTSNGVKSAAEKGRFVRLAGNADYKLHGVSHPYLTATTRTFVERLASQYRAACGEQLVVTSAIRPLANQPRNSSDYSVHPTGIAVDLRKPSGKCLTWLRKTLLALEDRNVIDGTEEKSPPHFHVVVFPAAYDAYVESLEKRSAQTSGTTAAAEQKSAVAPRVALATVARMPASTVKYRVRKGDSLWSIAKRYDTSVAKIQKLNPSAAKKIVPGQTLVLSSASQ